MKERTMLVSRRRAFQAERTAYAVSETESKHRGQRGWNREGPMKRVKEGKEG